MARDLDLNINGNARRAQQALNDVATGAERAARITDHLSRSYDHLENEANDAQRALDRVNDEIAENGPTAELNAELAELQRRLAAIGDERRGVQDLQGQFRRATAAAAQLDHQLAATRRELDRLNDEYGRGRDPAVLRQIQEQQRELQRLAGIRRRIAAEDEENQRRLGRIAAEAHRARMLRDEQARRQADDDERSRRGFLGNAARLARRGASAAGDQLTSAAEGVNKTDMYTKSAMLGAAIPVGVTALAAAGGAVIGAGAIAAVGIGIKGAIDGPGGQIIKDEFGSLVEDLQGRLTASTADWFQPLVGSAHTFGDALDAIPMEQIFGDAKDYIEPLSEGFADLAEGAGKGFAALVHEAGPVVERLGQEFGELGDDIDEAFTAISMGSQGGADALGDILDLTGGIIRGFGKMVLGAEAIYETLENAPVTGWFHDMWAEWLESDAPEAVPAFAADLDGVAQSTDGVAASTTRLAGVQELLADASKRASDNIASELGILMSVDAATDAATEAYQGLLETLKQNGYVLEGNSKKALENRDAIRETIGTWEDEREAAVAAGKGSAEATDAANAALLAHLVELRRVLAAHGANTREVDEYIAAVKRASGLVLTTIFRNVYENIGTPQERQKTGQSRLGGLGQYAAGGSVSSTGFSLVGENGPELHFMNEGDYVATAAQTKQLLSAGRGGRGGSAPTIMLTASAPAGGMDQALVSWFVSGVRSGAIALRDSSGQPVKVA